MPHPGGTAAVDQRQGRRSRARRAPRLRAGSAAEVRQPAVEVRQSAVEVRQSAPQAVGSWRATRGSPTGAAVGKPSRTALWCPGQRQHDPRPRTALWCAAEGRAGAVLGVSVGPTARPLRPPSRACARSARRSDRRPVRRPAPRARRRERLGWRRRPEGGHQRSSEVIIGHQWSSACIKGHQSSSV